jgi:hypothetical protein
MRDYSTLQEQYTTLLHKSEESKLAANLERREIGEQFRIVDTARLPEKPYSPNRLKLNAIGLLAGLGIGVAIVGLLAYRDTTFKTDDDILTTLALPVFAIIPLMSSTGERQRKKRRRVVVAVAASTVSALVVAGVLVWRLNLVAWVR